MAYCALSPVSAAVYTALNVAALTGAYPATGAGCTGGVTDDPEQGVNFPFLWYEVREAQAGGFGTVALPEVELRVHVFSTYQGMSEAQRIVQKAIELLRFTTPVVSGYSTWAIFHDETIPLSDQVINGVKVKELVALFRVYVEET